MAENEDNIKRRAGPNEKAYCYSLNEKRCKRLTEAQDLTGMNRADAIDFALDVLIATAENIQRLPTTVAVDILYDHKAPIKESNRIYTRIFLANLKSEPKVREVAK